MSFSDLFKNKKIKNIDYVTAVRAKNRLIDNLENTIGQKPVETFKIVSELRQIDIMFPAIDATVDTTIRLSKEEEAILHKGGIVVDPPFKERKPISDFFSKKKKL
jgi:hypothetical protein